MLLRLSTKIIKRIQASYCFQNQVRSQIETTKNIDDLEKTQLEWIYLAQQKHNNQNESDEEELQETKQDKENKEQEESESESDDDDDPQNGRKIPLIELVKGFIPRLLKPDFQE